MKRKIQKNIIFSKTPLKTHLKVGDHFQIYPCNLSNAPKSNYCHDFPLIIEYWIDEDEKIDIPDGLKDIEKLVSLSTLQTIKLNHITRLLSSITNHRIFVYGEAEFKWGIPIPKSDTDGDEIESINNLSSQSILGIYTYPNIFNDLQLTDFSEQTYPNPKYINHLDYYFNEPVDDANKEIVFPETILETIENYYYLESVAKKTIDSITHLICNGIDIKLKMKSISFLSFVSAIETMVNYEFKGQKEEIEFDCSDCQSIKSSPINCPKCGKPIWGIKAKYNSFLKNYISSHPNSIKKYNKIYNLRSKIVHAGELLLGDEQLKWDNSGKSNSEYITHLESMQLARLSLVNWLLLGPNKK